MTERLSTEELQAIEGVMRFYLPGRLGFGSDSCLRSWQEALIVAYCYREVLLGRYSRHGSQVLVHISLGLLEQFVGFPADGEVGGIRAHLGELEDYVEAITVRDLSDDWVEIGFPVVGAQLERLATLRSDESRGGKVTPRMRRFVERFEATCQYCKRRGTLSADPDGRYWTKDHVRPVSFGGDNSPENLVLACWSCNSSKRDKPVEHFPAKQENTAGAPGRLGVDDVQF